MKGQPWVWLCASLALGLLVISAGAGLASHSVQLPTRDPWPTAFQTAVSPNPAEGADLTLSALATPGDCSSATTTAPANAAGDRSGGVVAQVLPCPTPTLNAHLPAPTAEVSVSSAAWKDRTLTVAVTVRRIWGDYLLEPPVLHTGAVQLPVAASALTVARMTLLTLGAGSEATLKLAFQETLAEGAGTLVFNPGSTPDSLIAPRVDITVTWPMTATAAVTP